MNFQISPFKARDEELMLNIEKKRETCHPGTKSEDTKQ